MPQKQHARQLGADRAGLDDFSRAADKSGLAIPQIAGLRQAADRQMRRQQLARRLHRLGDRATFEFIDELARRLGIGNQIDDALARYARLDLGTLAAVGGDRFPAGPLRAVGGGQ